MSRSVGFALAPVRLAQGWMRPLLTLSFGLGLCLLVVEVLLSPPSGDLERLAVYLTLSGASTIVLGWTGLRLADRLIGLKTKSFLSSISGSIVALLNVVIVAQLMFVSTRHDLRLLIALIAFSTVVSVFFSLWVASNVIDRVHQIAKTVAAISGGSHEARADISGRDEVAALARNVNALAQDLQRADDERRSLELERRELTAAISHDLRTPLASIRAMTEALADGVVEDAAEVQRYYGVIQKEVERLNFMIDDLLELARMDAQGLHLELHPLFLDDVAAEVVAAMQATAQHHGVSLSFSASGLPREVAVDGQRIKRAIANLVGNALEHTAPGGQVRVEVAAAADQVRLSVRDNGQGIVAADLPFVWDRFFRGEKSRHRGPKAAGGVGLGLTIVRSLVEAHGGRVEAKSVPGEGSVFAFALPLST